jgi:asparagine synthase (glutamine-hydrolysing)
MATLGHELVAYHWRYGGLLPYLALRTLRPFAPTRLQGMMRRWQRGSLGIAADFAQTYRDRHHEFVERSTDPLRGFLAQLLRYSIPMLLRFEDRNSMAHSIEARVPFLDHRLVEYAFTLPPQQKIHDATTKVVLRNALKGALPEVVRQRHDKMGFVAPEREWLAHALREWVYDVVNSRSFCARIYFDPVQIKAALADHMAGRRDLTKLAWRWLNLELWLRQMIDGA